MVGAAWVVGGCFDGGVGEALVGVALDFLVWIGIVGGNFNKSKLIQ